MSTGLVTITPTQIAQPPVGGGSFFGGSSKFLQVKPANVELQQKMSRAEGAVEGKFRNSLTGQHYDELQVVMMFDPTEPRAMYRDKNNFGEEPICYSMNGETPSDRAKDPQSPRCATCRHGNIGWDKWHKSGKKTEFLPKCKSRYSVFCVDRVSKLPFRLGVRGKSIAPFKAIGAQIAAMGELYLAENGHYPNLYDFTFKIKAVRKVDNQGVYYLMVFSDVKQIVDEEDKAEFGALFAKFSQHRQQLQAEDDTDKEDTAIDNAMSEATASRGPIEGEYVDDQKEVTI